MQRFHWIIWISIVCSLILFCQEINGLKCLQCNSLKNDDCRLGRSEAKECSGKDFKFCITYSGASKESGTHVLFRDCSKENMTSDCQMVTVSEKRNETKPIKFRVCYQSCDTDGCNRDAHNLSPSLASTINITKNNVATFLWLLFQMVFLVLIFI